MAHSTTLITFRLTNILLVFFVCFQLENLNKGGRKTWTWFQISNTQKILFAFLVCRFSAGCQRWNIWSIQNWILAGKRFSFCEACSHKDSSLAGANPRQSWFAAPGETARHHFTLCDFVRLFCFRFSQDSQVSNIHIFIQAANQIKSLFIGLQWLYGQWSIQVVSLTSVQSISESLECHRVCWDMHLLHHVSLMQPSTSALAMAVSVHH